ncbi:hypothetical protein OCT63_13905 [Vibrio sp. RW]|uniref:hypothetical protein n=1 Tax=Vibrio sp. RW TaxID=2998833 RepID=UPI0022CD8B92|nr:hypothetical protein [Vibrio sp. RW]MDA0145314.1 hypothetical protein [Vibrio sp. RW]
MSNRNMLVHGVGINDLKGASNTTAYRIWRNMLKRCYCPKYHVTRPTYKGCTVCCDWLVFSSFKRWFDKHYVLNFELDKDLLVAGNKQYAPENCRFVPARINSLLGDSKAIRGSLPTGVALHGKSYRAYCTIDGMQHYFGTHDTVLDALRAYSKAKLSNVKRVCNEEYINGNIQLDLHDSIIEQCRDLLVANLREVDASYQQPVVH